MNASSAVMHMMTDPKAPTAPLDQFRLAILEDDNWWWRIACGHHMNLFIAACDRLDDIEARLALALNPQLLDVRNFDGVRDAYVEEDGPSYTD